MDCRGLIAAALCSGVQKPKATIPNCDCSVIICCTRHALYTVLPQIAAPTIPHRILHTLSQWPCRNTLNQPQPFCHLHAYSKTNNLSGDIRGPVPPPRITAKGKSHSIRGTQLRRRKPHADPRKFPPGRHSSAAKTLHRNENELSCCTWPATDEVARAKPSQLLSQSGKSCPAHRSQLLQRHTRPRVRYPPALPGTA